MNYYEIYANSLKKCKTYGNQTQSHRKARIVTGLDIFFKNLFSVK